MKYFPLTVIYLTLVGCAAQSERKSTDDGQIAYDRAVADYQKYSVMPTPTSWGIGKEWMFIYVDDNEVVNRLIAEPTSESVKTWVSGEWKRLNVIYEHSPMEFEYSDDVTPAYSVEGVLLSILMAGNISHTDSIQGRFDENGFVGEVGNSNPYCCMDEKSECCSNPAPPIKVFGAPLLRND